jgi:hypothetical protein
LKDSICDATDIIKNAMDELKRLLKMAPRTVSTTLRDAGRNLSLHKGTILKEM